ncbi:uncharacterized protein [Temnothorax longispinosus]|uniref:uncharacterized protein n=1 Tax=Temnothorax longispinosus TaxID=300112 RepID=UPI003A99C41C
MHRSGRNTTPRPPSRLPAGVKNGHGVPSEVQVPVNAGYGYRLIVFLPFFSTLSEMVKCKECGGNITFSESSIRGLGFKLVVNCVNCEPRYILSCPLINTAYEVNRRITFAMRLLGIGYDGIKKFCGLMDLPKIFHKNVYYEVMSNIHCASKAVATKLFSVAAAEEKQLTENAENGAELRGLTVSGDGTWRKRGFSSLQGVTTVIGSYTGKVLDLVVKCSYCKQCEYWKSKLNTLEFEEWSETHAEECSANHKGSAGKMEVDAAIEIFKRSEELYNVKYSAYVGDGDCKTFKGICESHPYGDDFIIIKKECVGHVQKRMGARLRKLRKDKRLGGKGKLTAKLIDELSIYYGLAIRRHANSAEDMKKEIWATLKHKSSTDEKPQHDNCPPGKDSWCTWQQAKAKDKLAVYKHKPALTDDVIKALTPIYEELSNDNLLSRCVGGFTQNANESVNAMIWSFAPKRVFSGAKTVEVASYFAASIFNHGYESILQMMGVLNLQIGPNAFEMCEKADELRIAIADKRSFETSKQERINRRTAQSALEENFHEVEGLLYDAGMAD